MDEFRFENTLKLTEADYVAVWALLPKWRFSKWLRFNLLVVLGVVFLFTPYTLLLGLTILVLAVVALVIPAFFPSLTRRNFREHKYLRDTLTYGVSDNKIWIQGDRIDASVPWSMLVTWRETESWLVLSPSGIPPVYLSLARLREEGLYGRVRALSASNAPEFNKSSTHSN